MNFYWLNFLIVFTFGKLSSSLLPIHSRAGIFLPRNPYHSHSTGTKSLTLLIIRNRYYCLRYQKMLASTGEFAELTAFACPVCNQGFVSRNAMYRHLRSDSSTMETSCKELAINQGLAIYPKDGINFDHLKRQTVVLKIAFSDYSTNLQIILEEMVQGKNYIKDNYYFCVILIINNGMVIITEENKGHLSVSRASGCEYRKSVLLAQDSNSLSIGDLIVYSSTVPAFRLEESFRTFLDPIITELSLRNVFVLAAELLPKSINVQAVYIRSP